MEAFVTYNFITVLAFYFQHLKRIRVFGKLGLNQLFLPTLYVNHPWIPLQYLLNTNLVRFHWLIDKLSPFLKMTFPENDHWSAFLTQKPLKIALYIFCWQESILDFTHILLMSFSIAVIVLFVWIREAQYLNNLYSPLVAFLAGGWKKIETNVKVMTLFTAKKKQQRTWNYTYNKTVKHNT